MSESLLDLWQSASAASVGIAISTNDRQLLRMQLYRVRAEDGGYQDVVIIFPQAGDELWLVKQPKSH